MQEMKFIDKNLRLLSQSLSLYQIKLIICKSLHCNTQIKKKAITLVPQYEYYNHDKSFIFLNKLFINLV